MVHGVSVREGVGACAFVGICSMWSGSFPHLLIFRQLVTRLCIFPQM